MSDQQEEQEMEAEALTAIFEDHFEIIEGSAQPFVWKITLWPEATSSDADAENHVGVTLVVTLPPNYPEEEESLPDCEITILKGLTQDHAAALLELAKEEATANVGVPSIFAICERLREWLVEHNQKGHDDVSMHAQMLRRDAEAKKKEQEKEKLSTLFESQKAHDEMTQAERDELEMRRKRAEGTPVTPETFEAWKVAFEEEMRLLKQKEAGDNSSDANRISKKAKAKSAAEKQQDENKAGRLTGFQQFSDKAINLEALEAAAENAQTDPDEEEADKAASATATDNNNDDTNGNEGAGIQEELFDVDDEDLDDLDFDDEDEEEDENVDI